MNKTKPFNITKQLVMEAYKLVKANAGTAGVDEQSLAGFDKDLKDNLYRLWNRMSSGAYFPPPVKAIPIPKKQGGERVLGVPTVTDRIAQQVVKLLFEPKVEPHFHPDSYGYRPHKSAIDAIGITRRRCWQFNWVLEFDIKGLFDNIPHNLLMKAVKRYTNDRMLILYIERWLKAPIQLESGRFVERRQGTPQGGVISPILSNLFLHYVFDVWMTTHYPTVCWCRYADDGLVHCRTEQQARHLLVKLGARFKMCGLELHLDKTKIVYCKDEHRKGEYAHMKFDFLGYTFCRRSVKNSKDGSFFVSFTPAVSVAAMKSMRAETRRRNFRNQTELSLDDIAKMFNPVLRGWINYYGRYTSSALNQVLRHFNKTLVAWAMKKYKQFRGNKTRASTLLRKISEREPQLFVHWRQSMGRVFA